MIPHAAPLPPYTEAELHERYQALCEAMARRAAGATAETGAPS